MDQQIQPGPSTPPELPTFETLLFTMSDGVAVVALNRPPVNAVNRQLVVDLRAAFDFITDSREVNSAILCAAPGSKAFCGGVDLNEAQQGFAYERALRLQLDAGLEWRETQAVIRNCAVPVILAIEGIAVGAGCGLVGVCDIVIASETARFGLPEINVGLLGGASKALKLVGPGRARRMFFTGIPETAAEFHRLGGADELVPAGQAFDRAMELGKILATKSPLALRLAKESVVRIEGEEMAIQYRTEQDYTARLMRLNDSKEAMAAFLEKREPSWTWS